MNLRLVNNLPPIPGNPRNSEGAFARGFHGEILFVYSRFRGDSCHDNACSDIALTVSKDEGETWSEPRILARSEDFGVVNIMSVSAVEQTDGTLGFYFLVLNPETFHTGLGRLITADGENFRAEVCRYHDNVRNAYYCVNNDRIVRLSDGRLMAPYCAVDSDAAKTDRRDPCHCGAFLSDDDGKSFYDAGFDFVSTDLANTRYGYQEPGVIERSDGSLYYWIRTGYGRQYECISTDGPGGFCPPYPSIFTSPVSPMQIKEHGGIYYNAYNPKPRWNGYEEYEKEHPGVWSRSPMVLRKSSDEGKTWGPLNIVGDDPDRGYSYPAMFFTKDGHLLLGICRGSGAEGNNLCTLGILKIDLATVE